MYEGGPPPPESSSYFLRECVALRSEYHRIVCKYGTWAWAKYDVIMDAFHPNVFSQICLITLFQPEICDYVIMWFCYEHPIWKLTRN